MKSELGKDGQTPAVRYVPFPPTTWNLMKVSTFLVFIVNPIILILQVSRFGYLNYEGL